MQTSEFWTRAIFAIAVVIATTATVRADTFTGTIDSIKPTATHSFDLTSDGELRPTVTIDTTLGVDILVFDADGTTLEARFYFQASGTVGPLPLKAGRYVVRLNRSWGSGSYSVTTGFAAQATPNDKEPNEDILHAMAAPTNSRSQGHLGYSGGGGIDVVDWWSFDLASDGELRPTVTLDPTLGTQILIFDADGTTLEANYGFNASGTQGPLPIKAGHYLLRVNRNWGYGAYSVTIGFAAQVAPNDQGPNDDLLHAMVATVDGVNQGHLGYSGGGSTDFVDWWSFDLASSENVRPTVALDPTLGVQILIFDANGTTQKANYGFNASGTQGPLLLKAGHYLLRVDRNWGYGAYSISVGGGDHNGGGTGVGCHLGSLGSFRPRSAHWVAMLLVLAGLAALRTCRRRGH